MAVLIFAHPYPGRSRAGRVLLDAVSDLEGLDTHSLYDLYPDFDIDVAREQAALSAAELVIWQHPIHWYSVPSLLKHWFDKVLLRGWAYGPGGKALHGKQCLWVATTGGDTSAYSPGGMHGFEFRTFVPVIEQTARFCGMTWLDPIVLHAAHRVSPAALQQAADDYRARVSELLAAEAARTASRAETELSDGR